MTATTTQSSPAKPTRTAVPEHTPRVPTQRTPAPTSPRSNSGTLPDGRRWELLSTASGVTATVPTGAVAEARVTERGDEVIVDFWTERTQLPFHLRAHVVEQVFTHPAVHARRPVIVCVPRGDLDLLTLARAHVVNPRTHVAGSTALVEGSIREGSRPER